MKKSILKILQLCVLGYIILIALMFFSQRSLMYFPRPAMTDKDVQIILSSSKLITVKTDDNISLKAYLIEPTDTKKPIILAFHGNGALGLDLANNFKTLISKGYGVLFAEYRGYSGNQGTPTEQGLYHDADAYLRFLKENFSDNILIAYGQSLGSGVAVDLVSRNTDAFSLLILEVPFDSALNVARRIYPYIIGLDVLLKDKYLSDYKIHKISIPKLFMIAGKDDVVGMGAGQRLFELAPSPKEIEVFGESAHHNVFHFGAEKTLVDFIEKYNQ